MRIKRFIAIFLVLALLLSLGAAAMATDESQSFEFALTVDRSGVLKAGDELTITCTLKRTDKSENWRMYAWQTEIAYDNSAFELVEGSVKPTSGVGNSVHPGTLLDKVYFNAYSLSASGDSYPAELTAGTFTLRVTGTVSGLDLSGATGEPLDKLTVCRLCRIPLPEYGTTILEKVAKLTWRDKIKDRESVAVTLANAVNDVQSILKEEKARSGSAAQTNNENCSR